MKKNGAYKIMFDTAKERLANRTPQDIASKAGVVFDEAASQFVFESLGQQIHISYPDFDMLTEVYADQRQQQHLIILHYFDIADGTPPDPAQKTFRELPGGTIRGSEFDRRSESVLGDFFGDKPKENVKNACKAIGADLVASNADICAVVTFLPLYPITIKIWLADEEFGGSGKVLTVGNSYRYLTIEDAVVAAEMIIDALIRQYELLNPVNPS